MSEQRRKSVVIVGASITGNRGAEAMLRATLERLKVLSAGVEFSLLSLYPQADFAENDAEELTIIPMGPKHLLLRALPIAVVAGGARRLGLRVPDALLPPSLRSMRKASLVVDLSGISFVDGRGAGILAYNIALAIMPALVGTRCMKFSQAMGPFESMANRLAARYALRCVERIATRGRITHEHLVELGVPSAKLVRCADAAFVMQVSTEAERKASALLAGVEAGRRVIAVSASSVVDDYFSRQGRDYAEMMVRFIDWLGRERDCHVLLLAHSTRPQTSAKKNNDLPICREIFSKLQSKSSCTFPDGAYHADVLRALVGRSELLVASRFHAMISALAMGVPSLLVGWSHKYLEVLEVFEMEAFAMDYGEVDFEAMIQRFSALEGQAQSLRERIARRLPEVVESSMENMRVAASLLRDTDP